MARSSAIATLRSAAARCRNAFIKTRVSSKSAAENASSTPIWSRAACRQERSASATGNAALHREIAAVFPGENKRTEAALRLLPGGDVPITLHPDECRRVLQESTPDRGPAGCGMRIERSAAQLFREPVESASLSTVIDS